MKKTTFLYLSLAAIVAGSFASCQEEEMGFDYETVRTSLYEREFIKEFKQVDPNHQWGFNHAAYFMGFDTAPLTRAGESPFDYKGDQRVWKMDEYRDGFYPQDLFGRADDISKREYQEVYAWFSTHKVEWPENSTPKSYSDDGNTRPSSVVAVPVFSTESSPVYLIDRDFSEDSQNMSTWGGHRDAPAKSRVDESTGWLVIENPRKTSNTWESQSAIDIPSGFVNGQKYTLKFRIKGDNNANGNIINPIIQVPSGNYPTLGDFGEVHVTNNWQDITLETTVSGDGATRFLLNFGTVNGQLYIDNLQISTVASSPVSNELNNILLKNNVAVNYPSDPREALGSLLRHLNNPIDESVTSMNPPFFNGWIQIVAARNTTSPQMDYLTFRSLTSSGQENLNDHEAWIHVLDFNTTNGYGYYRQDEKQNAELVLSSSFGTVTYHDSHDSKFHDKYFIVKLEGDGYSGYYLGLDFESVSTNHFNGKQGPFKADGFCNDLIIKIGDAGHTPYNPSRIMCEDLGTNDFDFNDLVYDVEYSNKIATITIQAVGGTIPVRLVYGKYATESEIIANSLKPAGASDGELHSLFGQETTVPINVKDVTASPVVIKVAFPGAQSDHYRDVTLSTPFELNTFNIYVKHTDRAEWLNVENYNKMGGAPQKFCVPNTVKWTKENQHIKDAYLDFESWVQNMLMNKFWTNSNRIDQSKLW